MSRQDSMGQEHLKLEGKQLPSKAGFIDSELTERQHIILRLISEDQTNLAISELLGYSESTIRQDLIEIYTKLRCTSRKEATQIYRPRLGKSNQ